MDQLRAGIALCLLALVAVQETSAQGCLYEGRTYQQGQTWTKPCEYNCKCDDGTTGHYTCTAVCPTYNDLPAGCVMQQPPAGECCAKPVCNFATQQPSGPVVSGGGTQPGGGSGGFSLNLGGGSTSCADKISNCAAYGANACTDPQYAQWATDNCAQTCNKCGGSSGGTVSGGSGGVITGGTGGVITGGGTGGVMTGGGTMTCADKIDNCAAYGANACTDAQYAQWATDNCARTCNKCSGSGGMITGGGTGGVITGGGTGGVITGSCADKINNCAAYGANACTDPQYAQWATDNCAQTCNKCGASTGGTGTMTGGGSGTMTGGGTGTISGGGTGTMTGGGTGTVSGGSTGGGTYLIPPAGGTGGTMTGGGTGGVLTGGGTSGGTMTGTGTGGTMTGSCADKLANCADYGQSVCSDASYAQWVGENCARFCGCPASGGTGGTMTGGGTSGTMTGGGTSGTMTGSGTGGTMTGSGTGGVITGGGTGGTMTGSGTGGVITGGGTGGVMTGGTCADASGVDCSSYGQAVCSDPTYTQWVSQNCPRFCNKCGGTMTGSGSGTGGTMTGTGSGSGGTITGSSSGCVFKGTVYQQGQTFNDGCDYKCTCTNASAGEYNCEALCYTFSLPSVCSMQPPAAGKCCQTPSCPAGIDITYPAGYQAN